MSVPAIVMLAVSALIVWGGLLGSILLLRNHPERPELPEAGGYPDDEPHRQRRARRDAGVSNEYHG